jgi:transposase-like protein
MGKGKKQRRARRAFSDEFKAESVRLCKVGDRTITQVAVEISKKAAAFFAKEST